MATLEDFFGRCQEDSEQDPHQIELIPKFRGGGEESDCKRVVVNTSALKLSRYLTTLLERDPTLTEIQLNCHHPELMKIAEYLRRHDPAAEPLVLPFTPPKPLRSANYRNSVPEWEFQFVHMPKKDVLKLLEIAEHLDIEPLVQLLCGAVASWCRGHTSLEIKKMLDDDSVADLWVGE